MRRTVSTGVRGLDDVLAGGLTANRMYLVQGRPGAGKTTLALQFLMNGVAAGEKVLYVTLSETEEELRSVADSHGWPLDGMHIHEVSPSENDLDPDEQNTMFHPSEVELATTTRRILEDVAKHKPTRVVFDSLSEMRLLAGTPLRYRRQILGLKQYFATRDCTVLLLDDLSATDKDTHMQSIVHGVISLEPIVQQYGAERRHLRVPKLRGVNFRSGYHDYLIQRGGLLVFPRLVAAEHRGNTEHERLGSGIPQLDALLGGGLEQGTSALIVGAAGTGKSTLAAQFVAEAANRGDKSAVFVFDESPSTLITRCESLGVGLGALCSSGLVQLRQIDPAELSPGELIHFIRKAVEDDGVKMIVIDSLNGYLNAMSEEKSLVIQLHELLMYLGQKNVISILIGAHHGLIGTHMTMPIDTSYLADTVVLLRYYEAFGEVRQALSVVKKRGSVHERTIREFRMDRGRVEVGEPLRQFRGVLTGVPVLDERGSEERDR